MDEYLDLTSENPEKVKINQGGYDEIRDVDVPKKVVREQIPIPRPIKSLHTLPNQESYFPEPIKKQNNPYKLLAIVFGVIIIVLLAIWFNISFYNLSQKDFSIDNSVNVPEREVNINNEFPVINNGTTTVNIDFGDFTDEVANKIIEKLNLTNSSCL